MGANEDVAGGGAETSQAEGLVRVVPGRGTYVVPKLIDHGYLALGKQRFFFAQGR